MRRIEVVDPRGDRHDALVDVDDAVSVTDLEDRLEHAGFGAKPVFVNGQLLSGASTIAELGLENGATVEFGSAQQVSAQLHAGVYVLVVAGPDSGQVVALPEGGELIVGRSEASRLVLRDALLSAQHLSVRFDGEGKVWAQDLGSTNGTTIENTPLGNEPIELTHDAHVHLGSTVLTVMWISDEDVAVVPQAIDGMRTFPRQFRSAQSSLPKKIDPPKKPNEDQGSVGRSWFRALLPIVTGIGFAAITGRWIFLLVMAITPIVAAFEAYRRTKKRKSGVIVDIAQYEHDLAEFRESVTTVRRLELRRRRDAAHCGGKSVLLSRTVHRQLWERLPADSDFSSVAVGLAALASDVEAKDPDGALQAEQWGTPLTHHLIRTGGLAIVGPTERGRAVGRNLLINLAAAHGPADLQVVLLTDDTSGAEWSCARWLPHLFTTNGCTIATNDADRRRHLRAIQATIEQRTASGEKGPMLPVVIVIVDGTDLIDPADLRQLLNSGAEVGVTGITIDEQLTPEGAGAALQLGSNADEATFRSRDQPFVDDVIVSEMTPRGAELAARPMARLRQNASDDKAGLGGTVHLVELDPVACLTGPDLEAHWRRASPTSRVTIGATADGPMTVDIVKDGPHGLIGGTSGSGKTEFLKTLFVSLCLHNHPDDLAIVVVDFKGGVDHEAIRPLPHVVDVATNLDMDQFKRTIEMLRAEQTRRQDMLSQCGASNVVAYRAARERDPALPPMPRLLVVVDEFGELLSNPDGKEQLKELESITRIGRALGLHLLLVTQSFEGNLPSQIEANAGLRISLRVQKPGHSSIVLDSDAAAFIADSKIGRAFARFHGRELTEFQTARVAGRRQDAPASNAEIDLRITPFSVLGGPNIERAIDDVPAEDTDMFAMIEHISAATERSGWTRSAVPWPAPLPDDVSATALLGQVADDAVPIGLADVPSEQRRSITTISEHDEQLLVVGLPTTPIPEVLVTYATTLAAKRSADDVHIYGIDLIGRGMQTLEALPHCAAVASRNDALSLRMLRWISDVAAERRVMLSKSGTSNIWEHAHATGELPPQIVLLISGADRIANADSPQAQLAGPLQAALADAVGVRIQIVLGGLPRIAHHRLGMNIERKLVLQLNDRSDYLAIGAPRHFESDLLTERRAVDVPAGRLTQLTRLAPPGSVDSDVVRKIAASLPAAALRQPKSFADISWPLPLTMDLAATRVSPIGFDNPFAIGLELATGDWAWLDAVDDGPMMVVTGPANSGRSSTLSTIASMAPDGWTTVTLALSSRSPLAGSNDPALGTHCTEATLVETVESLDGPVLLLVDDLHRLEDSGIFKTCFQRGAPTFAVVAGPMDLVSTRTGIMRDLPASRAGILLAPNSVLDGSAIGLRRLPDEVVMLPKAGRGIFAVSGEARQVQVPLIDV